MPKARKAYTPGTGMGNYLQRDRGHEQALFKAELRVAGFGLRRHVDVRVYVDGNVCTCDGFTTVRCVLCCNMFGQGLEAPFTTATMDETDGWTGGSLRGNRSWSLGQAGKPVDILSGIVWRHDGAFRIFCV
jgi:hypothetical protein